MSPRSRREVLRQALAGVAVVGGVGHASLAFAAPVAADAARFGDDILTLEHDDQMRRRLLFRGRPITGLAASDAVRLDDGTLLDRFLLLETKQTAEHDAHGISRLIMLRGVADGRLERRVVIRLFDRYPGLALIDTHYRNVGSLPVAVAEWRAATHTLLAHPAGAWSYAGASYPDRRDWVQKAGPGFEQRNYLGMNASDYGGGTPMAVVWRPDVALAIGHVEPVPRLVSLPVAAQPDGTRIGLTGDRPVLLGPGQELALPETLVMVSEGDHFRALDSYRRIMGERGLAAPAIPAASYAPVWCAWGYERAFTVDQVLGTLPKARAVGLEWAVLDDGWQTAEGDWHVDRAKFPAGDADMKRFADRIKAAGLKPRLWIAPLAVDPGTDLLRDHPDMLLLDRDGSAQNVSFWNSFTLCPAYQPTIDYFRGQVRRIIGEWGFAGLKLDGQHLNGVAPCYNPAHRHARPEESVEGLQKFWRALYDEAIAANPQAVIEICPCGDSFAFHNVPAMNHTPASDPTSSWQVRLKGKSLKAMIGPNAPFAGDHVELSDGHDDFASTYGIGGIPSTKFTWPGGPAHPMDPLPPGGWILTPAKEALWRRWIALYQQNRLAEGRYRGELYDIGFDRPEAHVVERDGALHYAFYADTHDGPIELRGLVSGLRYRLTDSWSGAGLGAVTGPAAQVPSRFERFLLVTATPEAHA